MYFRTQWHSWITGEVSSQPESATGRRGRRRHTASDVVQAEHGVACLVAWRYEQEVPESCSSATEEVSVEWDLLRADLQAMFGEALEVSQSGSHNHPPHAASLALPPWA